jgi:hypothetical protein
MFDRVAAGAKEGVDAVGAVSVRGDLSAHAVGDLDDGGQLGVGELLAKARRGVGQDAARRGDLDDVGAGADLGADGAHAVVGTRADGFRRQHVQDVLAVAVGVAVAAVDRDRTARGQDARPDHVAAGHAVAQGEDGVVRRAKIGHGGEAREQRPAGVAGADHGPVRGVPGHGLEPGVRVLFAGQVDVGIDQAGQHEGVPQVDDLPLPDEAVTDLDDPVPGDHQSFIALHNAVRRVRKQAADVDEQGSPGGRSGRDGGRLLGEGGAGQQKPGHHGDDDRSHGAPPGTRLAPYSVAGVRQGSG